MQTKVHSLIKHPFQRSFILLFVIILLTNCADSQNKHPENHRMGIIAVTPKAEDLTALDYMNQAQMADVKGAAPLLIKAAMSFLAQGDKDKSLWLANKLVQMPLKPKQRYDLYLLQAQLLILNTQVLGFETQALTQLDMADAYLQSEITLTQHSSKFFDISKQLFDINKQPIAAAEAAMLEFSLLNEHSYSGSTKTTSEDLTFALWKRLSSLSSWQINALSYKPPPFMAGWQALLNYAQQYGYQPARLKRYLNQWQRKYPVHPGQEIINQLVAPVLDENTHIIDDVAVLLPLSGKEQKYGQVIQEGILAAYQDHSGVQLTFYDTNTLDYKTFNGQLTELGIDYILGPLLKGNVAKYLAQPDITTPTLLLNVPENKPLAEHITSLSMLPEDEAIQAATTLSAFAYDYPLILAHNDSNSKRIADAFIKQWQQVTSITPEASYFDQGRSMQWQIKASLDINQSKQRIDRLRKSISPAFKIKNKRNRRDIDMIYAIGTPTQIKLLKPYVDVNVSPFANVIPIYANSRSHSGKVDEATSRDLSGLVFAEMPWLLNSKQQDKSLVETANSLWPTRSDRLQLFFALGYDGYQLIHKLPSMIASPHLRYFGQTGTIKLDGNILTRSLLWGQYIKNMEKHIVLAQ